MVQAAAIATIEHLAPGRLFVGVGTGFTGRMAMGLRPLSWARTGRIVTEIQSLLAGQHVDLDGGIARMIHPPGFAPPRPIRVPFLIAANGPKGVATARDLGAGLIYGGARDHVPEGFSTLQLGTGGILLEDGETAESARVLAAAKITFALQYHLAYEGFFNPARSITDMPGGAGWLANLETIEPALRHLAVHDRHTVGVNDLDAAFIAQHPEALAAYAATMAVTPGQLRARVDGVARLGATRTSFQSYLGTDWESAIRSYARAVGF
jgi:5,10-methylenetetrahydromethanopterin reductase